LLFAANVSSPGQEGGGCGGGGGGFEAYPEAMVSFFKPFAFDTSQLRSALDLVCNEEVGATEPADIGELPLEVIGQIAQLFPRAWQKKFKAAVAAADRTKYVLASDTINVREEDWYQRYLQSVTYTIADIAATTAFKQGHGEIKIIGIEGDVTYGKRTRDEWTALQEDIDRAVRGDVLPIRPENQRCKLENLEEELMWTERKPQRFAVVASCPARIGDNEKVMTDVEAVCARFARVSIKFSCAGNTASILFPSAV
jgi:hypothetical protein